ncbi:MAG: pantetheine-phosphate adenylyltransferase [Aquiluna sp.]
MAKKAIYPGSFDPPTLGHVSVARRAAGVMDELEIVVVHNPNKKALFDGNERVELWKQSLAEAGLGSVQVSLLDGGLLATHAKANGADAIIKGLRTAADLEYELQFANMNRDLAGIETFFFATEPAYSHISSSLVREVASLGGDVSAHVPQPVNQALIERLGK